MVDFPCLSDIGQLSLLYPTLLLIPKSLDFGLGSNRGSKQEAADIDMSGEVEQPSSAQQIAELSHVANAAEVKYQASDLHLLAPNRGPQSVPPSEIRQCTPQQTLDTSSLRPSSVPPSIAMLAMRKEEGRPSPNSALHPSPSSVGGLGEQGQASSVKGILGDASHNLFSSMAPSLLLDSNTLRKALCPSAPGEASLLERYLFAVTYLSRLDATLESARQQSAQPGGATNPIFRDLPMGRGSNDWCSTSNSLTIWIHRYPHPGQRSGELGSVTIHLYLCEEEFRLKAKLSFDNAVEPPPAFDAETFEQYFAYCVARTSNEMAMHTFITICRMPPLVFSAFAELMRAEMAPNPGHKLKMNIQLVTPDGPPTQRRILPGVSVTGTCNKFLLMITFRPMQIPHPTPQGSERAIEKKTLPFAYEMESGRLGVFERQGHHEDPEINNILAREQSMRLVSPTNSCCIWPCVRGILENYQLRD